MPPKNQKGEDKARAKEKEKAAQEKTFGLKNKNKSKAVQKYIKNITSSATNKDFKAEENARKEKEEKHKEMQKTALLNSLFDLSTDKRGRAYDPQAKKQAKKAEEDAIAGGKKLGETTQKEIIEGIANTIRFANAKGIRMSELGKHPIMTALKEKHQETFQTLSLLLFIKFNSKVFWVDDPDSSNPTIRCQEDVDAEVEPDERPIEEIIEEKRRALPPGGTPVTPETFKAWKERREADRLASVEEERQQDILKKGGKGLETLSGKDLFTYDASLFVDDDGAASADEYDERDENAGNDDNDDCAAADSEKEEEDNSNEDNEDDGNDSADDLPVDTGASSSCAPAPSTRSEDKKTMSINRDLFLDTGDLPDDLDDLDD